MNVEFDADDYTRKIKDISTDMKNLKLSLDALSTIERSSSSELVRETLRKRRIDLIQTRELLNAMLEHINYEKSQSIRPYHRN